MLHFWTDKVPTPAWITVFWIVIILINIWAVKYFAEVEVVASFIKFTWIIVVIISMISKAISIPQAAKSTNALYSKNLTEVR